MAENRKTLSESHKAAISAANTGKVRTEEQRERISRAHQGIPRTPEWRANMSKAKDKYKKAVIQYDLDGNEVARYESLTEAEKITGISKASILAAVAGRVRTAKGYRWAHAKEN